MKYIREHFGDIVLGLGIVILAGIVFYQQSPLSLGAGGPFNNVKQYLTVNADPYLNHAVSTTTQTNLVYIRNATTSYAFNTDGVDIVNFNILVAGATSTNLTYLSGMPTGATTSDTNLDLVFYYEFSDDQINWFSEDSNSATGGITTHVAKNVHTWTSGTVATSTKNIAITDVNSKYMRISFSSWTATSTAVGLWAQAILGKGY